jgi:tol-pal system protein YbgF
MRRRFVLGASALFLSSCIMLDGQLTSSRAAQPAPPLADEVQRLRRAVEEHMATPSVDAALSERLAQLGARVDQMESDLGLLKGKVDGMESSLQRVPANGAEEEVRQLKAEIAQLTARLETLTRQLGDHLTAPPPPPAVSPAAPGEPFSPAAAPADPKKLYDEAYGLLKQGKYAESQNLFREYIRLYPDTPLTDNAYFWMGEGYYDQGQYEQAILLYDKVVQNFPQGDKLVSALLKQAFAFDALGDPQDAKILLNKIVKEHASSEQAAIARRKLEALEK